MFSVLGGGGGGGSRGWGGLRGSVVVMLLVYKGRTCLATMRLHQMPSTPHEAFSCIHPSGDEDLWLRQRDGAWELWLGWLNVLWEVMFFAFRAVGD